MGRVQGEAVHERFEERGSGGRTLGVSTRRCRVAGWYERSCRQWSRSQVYELFTRGARAQVSSPSPRAETTRIGWTTQAHKLVVVPPGSSTATPVALALPSTKRGPARGEVDDVASRCGVVDERRRREATVAAGAASDGARGAWIAATLLARAAKRESMMREGEWTRSEEQHKPGGLTFCNRH